MDTVSTVLQIVMFIAFFSSLLVSSLTEDKHTRTLFLGYAILFKLLEMQISGRV